MLQAFPFPVSGELYKVSYEKLLPANLDTTHDLAHVVDTEAYYSSLTQDGTFTGAVLHAAWEPVLPAFQSLRIKSAAMGHECSPRWGLTTTAWAMDDPPAACWEPRAFPAMQPQARRRSRAPTSRGVT